MTDGNDMHDRCSIDQATQLRSPMRRPRRRASVIAITSGKGGVGKSNVAVNLAIKLASAGKRRRAARRRPGPGQRRRALQRRPAVQPVARHRPQEGTGDVMVDAPGGFRLIGGASGLARMADLTDFDRQRLVDALAELEAAGRRHPDRHRCRHQPERADASPARPTTCWSSPRPSRRPSPTPTR